MPAFYFDPVPCRPTSACIPFRHFAGCLVGCGIGGMDMPIASHDAIINFPILSLRNPFSFSTSRLCGQVINPISAHASGHSHSVDFADDE
jgi:hypothetical protein